jgi:hypothetical protein
VGDGIDNFSAIRVVDNTISMSIVVVVVAAVRPHDGAVAVIFLIMFVLTFFVLFFAIEVDCRLIGSLHV